MFTNSSFYTNEGGSRAGVLKKVKGKAKCWGGCAHRIPLLFLQYHHHYGFTLYTNAACANHLFLHKHFFS